MDYKYVHKNNKLKIIVNLTKNYLNLFPNSEFYFLWKGKELFEIQIDLYPQDTKDTLYLNLFEFSPKRLYDEEEKKYYYDYLSEEEKKYFRGKGLLYLCDLLNYGKSLKLFDDNSVLYTQATELSYSDSMLYESIPEKSSLEATTNFKKLVEYYEKIGFKLLNPINWKLELVNREGSTLPPLLYANMYSKVGNVKC